MFDLVYPSEPAPLYPRPSIDRPGRPLFPKDEMLPLVEPSGIVYGQAPRFLCHHGFRGLHPVVHLHIIDRYGKVYLQKRSMNKNRYPGMWDMAVGGHVTYGEQALETLFREAGEELGLQQFNPSFIEAFPYETKRDCEFVLVYAMVGHPNLDPDNAEVTEGKWWDVAELEGSFGKGIITPTFEYEFPRIKDRLLAML